MATVTTNYGFDVPQSTDLVKNGATQIALLGQDIDTFLFRPFTKNAIINGAMDVWQRGTSVGTSTVAYTADRYYLSAYNAMTVSRQATGDTTNLPFITYCARVQRNSGATGVNFFYFSQSIESLNSRPLAGKTVTFSYYARRGSNFSGASNALTGELLSGTGTDQNVIGGYTGSSTVISIGATLTTTWQRFTFTAAVPSTSNELGFYLGYTPVGTAGANDYFEITGVQLEAGSQATPFTCAGGNIQAELAMCQRYYFRSTQNANLSLSAFGNATSTTVAAISMPYPVSMRVTPTALDFSSVYISDGVNAFTGIASVTLGGSSNNIGEPIVTINAGTLTQFRTYKIQALTNGGYIGFTAEL